MPSKINMTNAHYVLSWLNKRFDLKIETMVKRGPTTSQDIIRKINTAHVKITWTKKLNENLAAKRITQKRVYLKFEKNLTDETNFKQKTGAQTLTNTKNVLFCETHFRRAN